MIAVYANWGFAEIKGCGWGWAGVIWLYSIIFYLPLDLIKFAIRYILSGKAWLNLLENKVFIFCTKQGPMLLEVLAVSIHSFFLSFLEFVRPPSRPRKIMVRRRGKLSGLSLREPSTGFSHLKPLRSSMTRAVTGSCRRSLSRQRGEPKLQGIVILCLYHLSRGFAPRKNLSLQHVVYVTS